MKTNDLLLTEARHQSDPPIVERINSVHDFPTTFVDRSDIHPSKQVQSPIDPARREGISRSDIRAASSLIPIPAALPTVPQLPLGNDSCSQSRCYLPPVDEGNLLLQEYLFDFNSKLPMFSPEALYTLYHECYSGAANNAPLTWVLVYATIGITHRLRAMSLFAAPDDTSQAEWYLGKSLAKLPELLMQSPSLRLIQASLTMAILLQTSNRCQRAPLFVSTALHMAQDLGYNEVIPAQHTGSISSLEESYVFWVAFHMDAHMSLANQRPGAQRLADISTPIPAGHVLNWWQPNEHDVGASQWNISIFALHCSLAMIEAEAAEELFSAKARRRSPVSNANLYESIMLKLEVWRESNALSKLNAKDVLKEMYRSDIIHSVVLEAAYFRTLYQLRATNALAGFGTRIDVFAPKALQSMVELGTAPCHGDAKRFLKLVVLMPQGNLSTTW